MAVQPNPSNLAARVRSRQIAEDHFVAELSNDADQIMTSMKSYDPLLTSVVIGAEGNPPTLLRCRTRQEQRDFYAASRAHQHMARVDLFTSLASDWYGFVHGVVTGVALATSEQYTAELVGLLPATIDEDTVAGEVGLSWPLELGKHGDIPGEVAVERVATVRAHDAWLEALRSADPRRLGDLYAPTAQFAMRHPVTGEVTCLEGREPIADYYARLTSDVSIRAVDVVTRLVDRWFVFTELAVHLDRTSHGNGDGDGDVIARLADICVFGRDDTILVHLGTCPDPA